MRPRKPRVHVPTATPTRNIRTAAQEEKQVEWAMPERSRCPSIRTLHLRCEVRQRASLRVPLSAVSDESGRHTSLTLPLSDRSPPLNAIVSISSSYRAASLQLDLTLYRTHLAQTLSTRLHTVTPTLHTAEPTRPRTLSQPFGLWILYSQLARSEPWASWRSWDRSRFATTPRTSWAVQTTIRACPRVLRIQGRDPASLRGIRGCVLGSRRQRSQITSTSPSTGKEARRTRSRARRLVHTKRPGMEIVIAAHKSVAELGVIGRAEDMHAIVDAERDATLGYLDRLTKVGGGRRGRATVITKTTGLIYAHSRACDLQGRGSLPARPRASRQPHRDAG